jgi:hypothetical protein
LAVFVREHDTYPGTADAYPRYLSNRLIPEVARILQGADEIGAPNRLRAGRPGANPTVCSGLLGHHQRRDGEANGQRHKDKENSLLEQWSTRSVPSDRWGSSGSGSKGESEESIRKGARC